MHLWPISPPQLLTIPPRNTELDDGRNITDYNILQSMTLPQANVLIMLTPTRVLIYNFKPMALVASHERTIASLEEFGENRSMKRSAPHNDIIEGLISKKDSQYLLWHQGKLIFYVMTNKNFLLAYQILKNCTNEITFKEYGIPVIEPLLMNDEEINGEEYDFNTDDDTLTVFDKNNSSRIIQNGFGIAKEKGFLHFLSNQENINELPVKKLELRLKVVLKFDYEIIDMIGIKTFSKIGDGRYEEVLIVLFPHGLQLLTILDFKVSKSSLVEVKNGSKTVVCNKQLMVISHDPQELQTIISIIDLEKQAVEAIPLLDTPGKLLTCLEVNGNLVVVFKEKIVCFDSRIKKISHCWKPPFVIKLCDKINDEILLLISENSSNIHFYTEFGNLLFATYFDQDDNDENAKDESKKNVARYEISDFVCLDKSLITVSHSGKYQYWKLWEEIKQAQFDFRSPKPYVLINTNNDVIIYSPVANSSLNNDNLQVLKLPTKTFNNHIAFVKINSSLKLLATYVSNKNILLIHNLETNMWSSFADQNVLDLHWLGDNFLVCHMKNDDGSTSLKCSQIPLQEANTDVELSDYVIWEYKIPENTTVFSVHVNTLFRYKLLKIKAKDNEASEKQAETLLKTAEVILVTDTQTIVFDVISTVHPCGLNLIKKFYQYLKINIPIDVLPNKIKWITNMKDGLLFYADKKFIKLAKSDGGGWQTLILLSNIERIVDVMKDEIFLIQGQDYVVYSLEELWDDKKPLVSIPIEEDLYPISITPETATTHTLHFIFNKKFSKLVVKHQIYLDQLILAKLRDGINLEDISNDYRSLKPYKFALEKILSTRILQNDSLDEILQLVKMYDNCDQQHTSLPNHSGMLEIISNCLRKIETKYWNHLFTNLKMTPRDLLDLCIEENEAKMLGILLLVFLNYDEKDLVDDLHFRKPGAETKDDKNADDKTARNSHKSVTNVLKDEELMLKVLELLVTSAANATDPIKATDSWDMCFQLIRLLKELDKENNTQLVQKAIERLK
ncbi:Ric1p SKDI_12G0930 [Saccharomyces kudriavzevii IFO 1802]|uniref:Uncharacterized protein n=2 Tax=Saccharomyces kudriavzevii (strain ATCC MYA-4449 / AS 2.2408 / CBS 8840 / NBRC 1802 / NCYC 2889) TaxID=226230 RepID=A0AA35J3N4_SACK1|nr:uncharacterized protein SKDI_12G0930 [Saccharomyces kudriavzevii IFO 1802]EJT41302.1 RIC1-like protein [Saccharomyces kudriavzevii IFO 1802]CAI4045805.1 hypothetical protein SKDI_12G0930 [Saccharomyces kudriavzevii IFO 1802]